MFKNLADTVKRVFTRKRIPETPIAAAPERAPRRRISKRFPGLAGKYLGKACGRRFASKVETEACIAAAEHAG